MHILDLNIQTAYLAAQRAFYSSIVQLPVLEETSSSCTFEAGTTRLTFAEAAEGEPTYHLAFNIPRNKLGQAREWLVSRHISLLRQGDRDTFDFVSWQAQAVYFSDPAGNILEFIARQAVPHETTGPFCVDDILCVSEVGLPVDDVPTRAAALSAALGLAPYREQSPVFAPLGDDNGLIIIVDVARPWFPTNKQAVAAPLTLAIDGTHTRQYRVPHLPYEVHIVPPAERSG